jgi:hypothetical protein
MATKLRRESEQRRRLNRQLGQLPDGPPPSFRTWMISGVAAGIAVGLVAQLFHSGSFSVPQFFVAAAMWFVLYGPAGFALSLHRWRAGRNVIEDEPWPPR